MAWFRNSKTGGWFEVPDNDKYESNLEAYKLNQWEKELDKIKKANHAQNLKDDMQKRLKYLEDERKEANYPGLDSHIRKLKRMIKRIENGNYGPEDF